MDTSQKKKIASQPKGKQQPQIVEEPSGDRLTKMLAFINHLGGTPPGAAELQRRRQLFGECTRGESESADQFYRRLRFWMDRQMPDTELSLYVQSKID